MTNPNLESCANCGTMIGRLEHAMLWDQRIVCAACHRKLSAASTSPPVDVLSESDAVAHPLDELARLKTQPPPVQIYAAGPHYHASRPAPAKSRSPFAWGFLVTMGVIAALLLVGFSSGFIGGFIDGFNEAQHAEQPLRIEPLPSGVDPAGRATIDQMVRGGLLESVSWKDHTIRIRADVWGAMSQRDQFNLLSVFRGCYLHPDLNPIRITDPSGRRILAESK